MAARRLQLVAGAILAGSVAALIWGCGALSPEVGAEREGDAGGCEYGKPGEAGACPPGPDAGSVYGLSRAPTTASR